MDRDEIAKVVDRELADYGSTFNGRVLRAVMAAVDCLLEINPQRTSQEFSAVEGVWTIGWIKIDGDHLPPLNETVWLYQPGHPLMLGGRCDGECGYWLWYRAYDFPSRSIRGELLAAGDCEQDDLKPTHYQPFVVPEFPVTAGGKP